MIRPLPRAIGIGILCGSFFGLAGCGEVAVSADKGELLETPVQRKPWDGPDSRGWQINSEHYSLYTTVRGGETISLMPAFMEAARKNYLRLLNLPDRPAKEPMAIYLLATRGEWASLTKAVLGDQADTFLQIQNGGYCNDGVCVFWQLGGLYTLQIASHEGFHQYMHHRLADQLPMWLEEGLCTQAEGYEIGGARVWFDSALNKTRRGDLESAIVQGYWIPLEKLLPMDAGDAVGAIAERAVGYYGQLWGLVRFIRSDPVTSRGLHRFIADAEAGRLHVALGVTREAYVRSPHGRSYNRAVSEKLFRYYISDDLPAFEKRYRQYCQTLCELR